MTHIPPEVPGPNPGGPGHYAHHDWHTAAIKALDTEAQATDADLAAITGRIDSMGTIRSYNPPMVNLYVQTLYAMYGVSGQTCSVWNLWQTIAPGGNSAGWASPPPLVPAPIGFQNLQIIGHCGMLRQGVGWTYGYVIMRTDGMIEMYNFAGGIINGDTHPANIGDTIFNSYTYPTNAIETLTADVEGYGTMPLPDLLDGATEGLVLP